MALASPGVGNITSEMEMQILFFETHQVGKQSYFKAFLEKGGFLMLKQAGKLLWYLLLGAAGPAEARYF